MGSSSQPKNVVTASDYNRSASDVVNKYNDTMEKTNTVQNILDKGIGNLTAFDIVTVQTTLDELAETFGLAVVDFDNTAASLKNAAKIINEVRDLMEKELADALRSQLNATEYTLTTTVGEYFISPSSVAVTNDRYMGTNFTGKVRYANSPLNMENGTGSFGPYPSSEAFLTNIRANPYVLNRTGSVDPTNSTAYVQYSDAVNLYAWMDALRQDGVLGNIISTADPDRANRLRGLSIDDLMYILSTSSTELPSGVSE